MSASSSPIPPPASRWERAQAVLLAVNLGWTTLANGGYGAKISLVTVCLTGALVAVHALERARAGGNEYKLHPAGWLLLPFLVYALANVLWVTPVRWLGWRDWLGWAQMIAVFWVVLNGLRSRGPRRVLFYVLIALGILGVVLGCYQRFVQPEWKTFGAVRGPEFLDRASGSFSIPNSFAGYLLLLLPAVAALALRRTASAIQRVWWTWVGVVLTLGLVLTLSRGAWLCLALALPLWALWSVPGGWRRRAGWAGLIFLGCVAVAAVVVAKYPTARTRFTQLVLDSGERTRPIVWRGAWRLFQEAPLFGTGAGSYNIRFERYRPEGFRDEPMWAHNEYLNTLSDYGAAGLGLFLGGLVAIGSVCLARPRRERRRVHGMANPLVVAGMGAGLLAFALQLALDFHFKIPALALACAVMAGLAVRAAWPPAEGGPMDAAKGRRWAAPAIALAALAGVFLFFRPMLAAEALRVAARQTLAPPKVRVPGTTNEGSVGLAVRDQLRRATQLDASNAQIWADLAGVTASLALEQPARAREFGQEAEAAANRALERCGVCSEFWIRRAVARDLQGRWQEAGWDFQKAIALAPADSSTWYYYGDHLGRVTTSSEAAEAAIDFCLRLDPGNQAALALRQRLAIKNKAP